MVQTLYWNFRRDNIDYDKFDQGDTSVFNDTENPYVGKGNTSFWDRNSNALNNLFSCENISKVTKDAKKDLGEVKAKISTKFETFKDMNSENVKPSSPKNIDKLSSIF